MQDGFKLFLFWTKKIVEATVILFPPPQKNPPSSPLSAGCIFWFSVSSLRSLLAPKASYSISLPSVNIWRRRFCLTVDATCAMRQRKNEGTTLHSGVTLELWHSSHSNGCQGSIDGLFRRRSLRDHVQDVSLKVEAKATGSKKCNGPTVNIFFIFAPRLQVD